MAAPPKAVRGEREPRLRILYIVKHAPYNAGEERTVSASVARRMCQMQVAVPAPKRDFVKNADGDKIPDTHGGWSMTEQETKNAAAIARAKKEAAGDYAEELEDEEKARKEEEERVAAEEAEKKRAAKGKGSKAKPAAKGDDEGAFLKGKKEAEKDGAK